MHSFLKTMSQTSHPQNLSININFLTCFFAVISTHDGTASIIHCSCGSTAHYHPLLLLCWECVLCHTHCHLMLILPSQFNPLCHTLWVCTRSWTVFYLQHHYCVLARWPCSWYKYHSCQHNQADHAWRVFLRQHSNCGLQWVSWPQLHKYGGPPNIFLSIYILQQRITWEWSHW